MAQTEARPMKDAKAEVDYSLGKGSDRCDNCRHFEPPDACELVRGKIEAKGWCKLFSRKS